jgi:hypothetical protein
MPFAVNDELDFIIDGGGLQSVGNVWEIQHHKVCVDLLYAGHLEGKFELPLQPVLNNPRVRAASSCGVLSRPIQLLVALAKK